MVPVSIVFNQLHIHGSILTKIKLLLTYGEDITGKFLDSILGCIFRYDDLDALQFLFEENMLQLYDIKQNIFKSVIINHSNNILRYLLAMGYDFDTNNYEDTIDVCNELVSTLIILGDHGVDILKLLKDNKK
jgi:hypothetical protein